MGESYRLLMFLHIFFLYFSFNKNLFFEFFDVIDVETVIELIVESVHTLVDK